jgi:hypothetical protein
MLATGIYTTDLFESSHEARESELTLYVNAVDQLLLSWTRRV